jgi:hypothetical protein
MSQYQRTHISPTFDTEKSIKYIVLNLANFCSDMLGAMESSKYFLCSERIGFRSWAHEDFVLAKELWGDPQVTRLFSERGRIAFEQAWNKYVSPGFVIATKANPELVNKHFGIGPSLAQRLLWQ